MNQATVESTEEVADPSGAAPPEQAMPWIEPLREQANAALAQTVEDADLPDNLREAIRYSLLGGGKRIRPVLCLLAARAAGGDEADALPAAVALEVIHCFSLIHDDLPAMDDDDLRRGQPTLHVHAGEAMAILAGDVLQTMAFQMLARCPLSPDRITLLTEELAEATRAMIAGQVWDTIGGFPAGMTDAEKLDRIHTNKTGALIRASCRMGAISVGAPDAALEALTSYGETIGLMFQIVDDLLDVTQSTEHLGKAAGKDEAAGKLTFPGVHGIERSKQMVTELQQQAHVALAGLDARTGPLAQLCDYLAVRTR